MMLRWLLFIRVKAASKDQVDCKVQIPSWAKRINVRI
jgi:hypothetical protein